MIPAAEAATVDARLRAPNDRNRGAAATSFMNDRRLFCSSLSGDMVFLSYSGKIEWVKHEAGETGTVQTLDLLNHFDPRRR